MTRAERKKMLKAEARAWRNLAESFAAKRRDIPNSDRIEVPISMWKSMARRWAPHRLAMLMSMEPSERIAYWPNGNVLACLFLALECDDEAAAL